MMNGRRSLTVPRNPMRETTTPVRRVSTTITTRIAATYQSTRNWTFLFPGKCDREVDRRFISCFSGFQELDLNPPQRREQLRRCPPVEHRIPRLHRKEEPIVAGPGK